MPRLRIKILSLNCAVMLLAFGLQSAYAATEDFKMTAIEAEAGDQFGQAVAVDGDTAIIGVPNDNIGVLTDSGSAFVYRRTAGGWALEAKLTASDAAVDDNFGYSVSISGDTVIVGATGDDDGGLASGSAYVFTRSGGHWAEQQKLVANDAAADDHFGLSVSVSGDTALIGAPYDDNGGADSGSAYVFIRTGTVWTQQQNIAAGVAAAADRFGWSVSVSGDTALVGAYGNDDAGSNAGSAYVFTRSAAIWTQQQNIYASDAAADDYFGISVSLSGDTAIIGAHGNDVAATDSGSAYVFTRSGVVWPEQQKLTASDAATGDAFGFKVSISGDTALVGAYGDDDAGSSSGSAYAFSRSGVVWSEQQKLTASDMAMGDQFGDGVSVSGGTALVGAARNDDSAGNSGSAYTFDLVPPTVCDPSVHDADQNANYVIGLSELLRVIQLFNLLAYHYCPESATEDGFCPGP